MWKKLALDMLQLFHPFFSYFRTHKLSKMKRNQNSGICLEGFFGEKTRYNYQNRVGGQQSTPVWKDSKSSSEFAGPCFPNRSGKTCCSKKSHFLHFLWYRLHQRQSLWAGVRSFLDFMLSLAAETPTKAAETLLAIIKPRGVFVSLNWIL